MDACRCGFDGQGPHHPCHSAIGEQSYACGKPAKQRFYNAYPGQMSALPGMQLKVDVNDTWACDECWVKFSEVLKRAAEKANRK